jgi:hypothetical protein
MSQSANPIKFRRNIDIGAADAENDSLYLEHCFVDVGDVATALDCTNPKCMPLLKNEWVSPPQIGPLLFIDRMVSNDAAGYALVKAEAAAGGGRRPAFTMA